MLLLRLLSLNIHIESNTELVRYHPVQGAPIRLMKGNRDLPTFFESGEDFSRSFLVFGMDGNLNRIGWMIRHAFIRCRLYD
ncbi:hypothetical protein [Neobacillus niacini]|uniref:hypothetical protein n=1 Tax=Neobacillus niacini TaxID=86668 RepID=UPI00203D18AF|nr:hypothetical protein [Neobacillus niacini]MCM3691454.1 hypothetical protein [Neobacillus niacini]